MSIVMLYTIQLELTRAERILPKLRGRDAKRSVVDLQVLKRSVNLQGNLGKATDACISLNHLYDLALCGRLGL